jgi:hypothetical protein
MYGIYGNIYHQYTPNVSIYMLAFGVITHLLSGMSHQVENDSGTDVFSTSRPTSSWIFCALSLGPDFTMSNSTSTRPLIRAVSRWLQEGRPRELSWFITKLY